MKGNITIAALALVIMSLLGGIVYASVGTESNTGSIYATRDVGEESSNLLSELESKKQVEEKEKEKEEQTDIKEETPTEDNSKRVEDGVTLIMTKSEEEIKADEEARREERRSDHVESERARAEKREREAAEEVAKAEEAAKAEEQADAEEAANSIADLILHASGYDSFIQSNYPELWKQGYVTSVDVYDNWTSYCYTFNHSDFQAVVEVDSDGTVTNKWTSNINGPDNIVVVFYNDPPSNVISLYGLIEENADTMLANPSSYFSTSYVYGDNQIEFRDMVTGSAYTFDVE